jgi:hypothetical protein
MIDGHDSKSAHLRTSSRSPSSVLGQLPQPCDATHHTTCKTRTKFPPSLLLGSSQQRTGFPGLHAAACTNWTLSGEANAEERTRCMTMLESTKAGKMMRSLGWVGVQRFAEFRLYSLGRITLTNTNPRIVCLMRREVAWPTPLLAQDLIGGPGWLLLDRISRPHILRNSYSTGQGVRLLGDLRHGSSREAPLRGAPIADLDGPRTENVKIWSSMFISSSTSQSLICFSNQGHQRASASLPHLDQLAKARILFSSTRRAETYWRQRL